MSLGSTEAIKRTVMEGVGVAIVSEMAVHLEIAAKKLIKLNVQNLRIERDIFFTLARRSIKVAAVGAFIRTHPSLRLQTALMMITAYPPAPPCFVVDLSFQIQPRFGRWIRR